MPFLMKPQSKAQAKADKQAPQIDWKTFDVRGAVTRDLQAAISFLHMISSNQELLDLVIKSVEDWRYRMIQQEKDVDTDK